MRTENCGNCKFWMKGDCECHIDPPTIHITEGQDGDVYHPGYFPIVFSSEWCGKHEKKWEQE